MKKVIKEEVNSISVNSTDLLEYQIGVEDHDGSRYICVIDKAKTHRIRLLNNDMSLDEMRIFTSFEEVLESYEKMFAFSYLAELFEWVLDS